ncbi:hypothetical protein C8R46DRAFT_1209394 [Mycena filopes]|nr:hypothetical protein C8R46DRAFT_1209394 [Mycena filopes]
MFSQMMISSQVAHADTSPEPRAAPIIRPRLRANNTPVHSYALYIGSQSLSSAELSSRLARLASKKHWRKPSLSPMTCTF